MLASQFLARALQPDHPSHDVVLLEPGPRMMKQTLRSKCWETVEPFLTDGIVPPGTFNSVKDKIHTKVVGDYVDARGSNRVLNARPPLIDPTERFLPRKTRATLSQLRSGFCGSLNDFRTRLGRSDDENCTECNLHPHTSAHLFDCATHPTTLTTSDLWERPWEAANYLSALPAFSHLPACGPPPPPRWRRRRRPPPEPPP